MDRARIEELLSPDIDHDEILMVRGTSVEEAFQMFETGFLPYELVFNRDDEPLYSAWLTFSARKDGFRGHSLYNLIQGGLGLQELLGCQRYDAASSQHRHMVSEVMGHWNADLDSGWYSIDKSHGVDPEDLLEQLQEYGEFIGGLKEYGAEKLTRELELRGGVCIGVNRSALELNIRLEDDELPSDETESSLESLAGIPEDIPISLLETEVEAHLPNGLPEKYVQFVRGYQIADETKLDDYLRSLD